MLLKFGGRLFIFAFVVNFERRAYVPAISLDHLGVGEAIIDVPIFVLLLDLVDQFVQTFGAAVIVLKNVLRELLLN